MSGLNQQLLDIGLEITEFVLTPDNDLVGALLATVDLRESAVMIVALRKADGQIRRSPHGTTALEAGDAIIVVGRHGDLPRSLRRLTTAPTVSWRGSSKG
jgi:Trk K+ transport system NAD-binding subunit